MKKKDCLAQISAIGTLLKTEGLSLDGLAKSAAEKADAAIKSASILKTEGDQIANGAERTYQEELRRITSTRETSNALARSKRAEAGKLYDEAGKVQAAIAALDIKIG
ncbi:MAG: hypothetical protein PHX34_04020 [Candidatus Shapirobacteria bacterium]|nr:hypothetical protein [Candidatus Shapirobacteria bacterium]